MYKIRLINMPFANPASPSIALAQLKAVTDEQFAGKVSIEIVHLVQDFARHIGAPLYYYISSSMQALYAGFGDWFFRHEAFPELTDNTDKYLRRYFWGKSSEVQQIKDLIAQTRPRLDALLDELITRHELDKTDLVGFTSMFMQNAASFAMAKKLKRRNPKLITVIGGANCEYPMGKVIAERIKDIDFVFSGPGLKSFPEFVQHCLEGDPSKSHSIRGIFAQGAASAKSGADILGEELSIDTPIALNYDDFLNKFDEHFGTSNFKPVLPFETSRGCWWGQRAHCTFCGLNGASMAYRAMKPELAIQQFKALFRYSGRAAMMEAVDNILPKSYIDQVLPFLDTPPDMEVFYEVKADLSGREMAVLAKARVTRIQPGIESLATSTLKLMKKGTTAFQNVNFLKNCALFGITPFWNILVGFPGEAVEVFQQYLEVIPLLTHLNPPTGVYPIRFDRFSPYHTQPESFGIDLIPMDFYSLVYPFSEAELKEFAYYFSDQNLQAEYFKNMTEWIQKVRIAVSQWQARWRNSRQGPPPRLYFKNDSGIIYDSRLGPVTEHSVGEIGQAILSYLARPVRMDELIDVFSAKYGPKVWNCVALLKERGLVFQEGDRLLSLVLEAEHGSLLDGLTKPGDELITAS
jgi:ribosomal peptide maturation radical SAM protein 1